MKYHNLTEALDYKIIAIRVTMNSKTEVNRGTSNVTVESREDTFYTAFKTDNNLWKAAFINAFLQPNYDHGFIAFEKLQAIYFDSGTSTIEDETVAKYIRYTRPGKNQKESPSQIIDRRVHPVDKITIKNAISGKTETIDLYDEITKKDSKSNKKNIEQLCPSESIRTDGGKTDLTVSGSRVRKYSADGTLYAYRDGDKHIVESNGRDSKTRWTKEVPAERKTIEQGEKLWTIPDNWEHYMTIKGNDIDHAIYYIPESGIDVLVSVPKHDRLVDAWYGVKSAGSCECTCVDSCDWDALEERIEKLHNQDRTQNEVIDALETILEHRSSIERRFYEEVEQYGIEAASSGRSAQPTTIRDWTIEPWVDAFEIDFLVNEFLDISRQDELFEVVVKELSNSNCIPMYPTIKIQVDGE